MRREIMGEILRAKLRAIAIAIPRAIPMTNPNSIIVVEYYITAILRAILFEYYLSK